MYVNLSIMTPAAGHERDLAASMQLFQDTATSQPGCRHCGRYRDRESGRLVGIAFWESQEAADAATPALQEALADDDLGTWVAASEHLELDDA